MGVTIFYHRLKPEHLEQSIDDADFFENLLNEREQYCDEILEIVDGWDGLHFVLSDERRQGISMFEAFDEFGEAIIGTEIVNDDYETDHGTPHYLNQERVMAIADLLAEVNEDDLWDNYKPNKMDQMMVYPEDWDMNRDTGFDMIKDAFDLLSSFYERAAQEDNAVIITIES